SCRLGFSLAPGLRDLARRALSDGAARLLSRHRLAQELLRVLGEKDPACPLRLLRSLGYAQLVDPVLRPPDPLLKTGAERLAGMALSLGPRRGEAFLAALPVERTLSAVALSALKVAGERQAPREALNPAAERALAVALGRLPKSAFKKRWLGGEDLQRLG